MENYDFSGWASKNDLLCSDGRIIRQDAFKHCDGKKVPLVWNHNYDTPAAVIGHAILENAEEGMYTYGFLNHSELGDHCRELLKHDDISSLSIYANKLKQIGPNVVHGDIKEVSLVISPANPGASIVSVLCHNEDDDETFEGIIYTGEPIQHSEKENDEGDDDMENESVQDIIDTMNEKQQNVMYGLVAEALKTKNNSNDEGDDGMKHNVFVNDNKEEKDYLSHSEMETILSDGKRYGSLKDSFLAHADTYGIQDIEYLFPDYKNVTSQPQFIQRDNTWVDKFMRLVHHTPFSKIKSLFADVTEDQARAKGYFKGNLKKEEVFKLLKRTTDPTTVYKKQKIDKDDSSDITDFEVVALIKREMRMMLDEEIARACLVGDGRSAADDDRIDDTRIRPIWSDAELYTIKARFDGTTLENDEAKAKEFIKTVIKSRKNYKGSGNPTLYTTEDIVTDCLLLTDSTGRDLYDSIDKLATKLRVKEIVTVPVMENLERSDGGSNYDLWGIIVNPVDYNVGADKGGAVSMFEDFDIDYNQMKYLIETRISGALTKPYSAIVIEMKKS